jgi:SAM-dependent methyltransferase
MRAFSDHWGDYHRKWALLHPPLRPHHSVVAAVKNLVGQEPRRLFLLGVTSELVDVFPSVTAMDRSPAIVAHRWAGDTASKKATVGDWLDIEPDGSFDAVIGDGSLNMVAFPDEFSRMVSIAHRMLKPGGRFACRVYERPSAPFVNVEPDGIGFQGFKWKLAMFIAAQDGAAVPVAKILSEFNDRFPDRDALAAKAGWSRDMIDTIDAYTGSSLVYAFPSRTEFMDAAPGEIADLSFVATTGYDLAECCPIFTFTRK